jgi:HD-like signal output (HDOD) protein/ActR/RegA family two-component response regulator
MSMEPRSATSTRKRIVFVDDETSILDGLRRALRSKRGEWDMAFALGGEAALSELRATPSQVIVSDMRMPGMDGATLLTRVQEEFPAVVRIILSGHADAEASLRVASVAHQILQKPCDVDLLTEIITRACDIDHCLKSPSLQRLIGQIRCLPSLPETYRRLAKALRDPSVSVDAISAVVECDIAISAKVLQIANSAFFGLPQRLSSIREAVVCLGVARLQSLVLSVQLFDAFGATTPSLPLATLQRHALASANVAALLLSDTREAEDAFAAALLHDVGLLVLATQLPDRCDALLARAQAAQVCAGTVELESGIGHPEVGAYLLGLWGLPQTIVEGVAYHHKPARVQQQRFGVAAAVHVAVALVHEAGAPAIPVVPEPLDVAFLESLDVLGQLPRWRELARGAAGSS